MDEARKQLRVLGDARNSDKIRAEAAEAIETEEQALSWLDLDSNASDDFVQAMFSLKVWCIRVRHIRLEVCLIASE